MRRFAWIPLIMIVSSCGGGSNNSPTSPTPTPTPPQPPAPTRPAVAGRWTGDYSIASCTTNGAAFSTFCNTFTTGAVLPMVLTLTGSETLSGTLTLGEINLPVTGPLNTSGQMFLNGNTSVVQGSITFQVSISGWDSTASGNTMTGGWTSTFTSTGGSGNGTLRQTIRALVKTG